MDESVDIYGPTILTGLGLLLTLCMPAIFMIAVIGENLFPYSMGSIIVALIVGMFTTPVGLLVLLVTFLMRRKRPEKPIKWRSALSGSCIAIVLGSIAWFMTFSFGG